VQTDVLIIGSGFAGAATAYHLAQSAFSGSVLIIDQEEVPGFHASGRNASLVLQSVAHPEVRQIIAASRRQYSRLSSEVGYESVGSLMLGRRKSLETLRQTDLIESEYLTPEAVLERIPILVGLKFESALWTPSDGVMDISQLLQFYLDGAREGGLRLELNCHATAIRPKAEGFLVESSRGVIETEVVVNAAGAWASEIARMVGLEPLPMTSYKRHLFILDQPQILGEDWPFVWNLEREFYMRPESGGLLFSVCDEEPFEDEFVQTVNPEISQLLAELIWQELPKLQEATQRQVWSCFRTKTPHGGFHLGWSDRLRNFLWVAGLGGHGMGASWEVGRIAAQEILQGHPQTVSSQI
jgi:glycine/D-amino acid oxidase-like deaminating enzyme